MRTSLNVHQKIPKVREYAELTLTDGTVLSGYVFVDATARIQDLLNDSAPFMPFIDNSETVHLINKIAIVRIQPFRLTSRSVIRAIHQVLRNRRAKWAFRYNPTHIVAL